MSRVLVTGAAGFIGSHLCDALIARGDDVVGVDSLTEYYSPARKRANLSNALATGLEFRRIDLSCDKLEPVVEGVDVVYHFAGQPGVRQSWGEDFDVYARQNLVATQRLLEATVRAGGARFVFASSSSVYGNIGARPARESDRLAPVSPYGLTKAACEELVGVYRRVHGLSAVSLRYFTAYGPRQRPEMAFASFIRAVLSGRPLHVLGDGRQTRDFTFVADVVSATIAAAKTGTESVYNISGGATTTLLTAIAEIERLTGRRALISFSPPAQGDPYRTSADLTAALRDLGYAAEVSLREGLALQVSAAMGEPVELAEAVA
jgi:nucleoside-diphosphate-sugar epimerase